MPSDLPFILIIVGCIAFIAFYWACAPAVWTWWHARRVLRPPLAADRASYDHDKETPPRGWRVSPMPIGVECKSALTDTGFAVVCEWDEYLPDGEVVQRGGLRLGLGVSRLPVFIDVGTPSDAEWLAAEINQRASAWARMQSGVRL